ncbi:MAG: Outer membrane protein assembly factor BamC [Pseudomonadales bacterium]|nr:Outer membrane protein assembly factor BamC [Pseudomonadales bacterium]
MRPLTALLLPILSVALAGCGWLTGDEGYFRDRGDDYRKARSIPPMKAPEGTRTEAVSQLYAIPVENTDALLEDEFEVPRPQPLSGDAGEKVVRIQKLGEEQWILLDETPAETWPKIRAFLVSNQIGIEREDASTGQMETSWLSFRSETTRREKYRFRVEQGVQRTSSEVYVLQAGYRQETPEDQPPAEWPAASADAERETWMLKELANYLAAAGEESSVSLLAQGISTVNKVYLVRDPGGRPVIDLRLGFDRAWASLGRALERADLAVKDLDRSAGLYYVVYEPGRKQDEEATGPGATEQQESPRKGFFARLWPWGGDDEDDNPATGRRYRVEMRTAEKGVLIGVQRDDGSDFEEGEVEFVLGLIKAHLS